MNIHYYEENVVSREIGRCPSFFLVLSIESIELPAIEDWPLGYSHATILAVLNKGNKGSYYLGPLLIGKVEIVLAGEVRLVGERRMSP